MTLNYIQILANIYNEKRNSAICTAAFASWTLFTHDDDEFLEECMALFLGWTVLPSDPHSLFYPELRRWNVLKYPPVAFNVEEKEECDGACCPSIDDDCHSEKDHSTDSSQSDSGYGSDEEDCSEDEDSEEERTSGLLRRTDLAGYTPVPSDSSLSLDNSEEGRMVIEAIEKMLDEATTESVTTTSSVEEEEKVESVCCPGPFADLVARLLPPADTPLLINGLLVPAQAVTVMDPPSSSFSDSHVCGPACMWCEWYSVMIDECEPLLGASTSTSSTTSFSSSEEKEEAEPVWSSGPFSDLVARLLPPKGTPLLINERLVPTPMDSSLSSLCLHDRSLSHHSILSSSSSSIDSHVCGPDCWGYESLPTDDECESLVESSTSTCPTTPFSSSEEEAEENDEPAIPTLVTRVPLTGSVHMGHSKGLPLAMNGPLAPSQTTLRSESSKMTVFRLMAECDVMMERIVELKKELRRME